MRNTKTKRDTQNDTEEKRYRKDRQRQTDRDSLMIVSILRTLSPLRLLIASTPENLMCSSTSVIRVCKPPCTGRSNWYMLPRSAHKYNHIPSSHIHSILNKRYSLLFMIQ